MTFKRTVVLTCLLCLIGVLGASESFSAMPDKLQKALVNCPKWIKLSVENTHFIWDLPRQKEPFLIQLESACYPGFLETRQLEILKEWVARGNILWIIFNPLRDNVPGNKDWAGYFGLNLSLSSKPALITRNEGQILPVRGLTEGVEILQLGTSNIIPAYYTFEGNILPVLKNREGAIVFGGQNFGAGRIIFDGMGWLFFETEKDWIDPLVFDSQVFWVNFFNWARTCVKPKTPKEEKVESFVAPPLPVPTPVQKKIDCSGLARDLKNKFPHLKIHIQERSNGDCVFNLDRVLFDNGKADLREEGRPVLDEIIEILKVHSNYSVRIEGHTDSKPIRGRLKKKFPTNWELSQARSQVVFRYFIEKGTISGDRMTTAGFGYTRPRSSNETKEGRQQNRRTEIILFIKPSAE